MRKILQSVYKSNLLLLKVILYFIMNHEIELASNLLPSVVGLDYLLAENYNIQFSPSDTHIDVSLFIIDDNELEDMETLFISLNNGPGAEYDMNSFANAVIIDDDYVTVDFDIESCALNIAESAGMAKITVAKIGLSSIPVDIMVSIQNGSATGIISGGPKPFHSFSLSFSFRSI